MSAPLALLSGVVKEMTRYAGEDDFFRSASQQSLGGWSAVGLAASGLAGAAGGASMAASGGGDPVEFFSCKVGDQLIRGRFSKASFKNGDEMEFVVEPSLTGTVVALAARRESDRVLWMEPHCSRGTRAHNAFSIRLIGHLLPVILIVGAAFNVLMEYINSNPHEIRFNAFAMCVMSVMAVLGSVYFPLRFRSQLMQTARQAQRIFAVLGYRFPALVDLPRDHKHYCKAHGISWPYLIEGNGNWIYHYSDPENGGK